MDIIEWNQSVKKAARALCGKTFMHFDDGRVYSGVIAETCGYTAKPGTNEELFYEPAGTIVLWPYRGRLITNIAAHDYDESGLVEIRRVLCGDEELGPLKFTQDFNLEPKNGWKISSTKGAGIYIAETPGLKEQRLYVVNVLDEEDHPDHRVAHWTLKKK